MIHSMTGFASAQTQIGARLLRLELRSVNGRFLDLYFRLPEDWRSFEPLLRERLQKALARGKIECRLEVQSAPVQAALTLDAVALQALALTQTEIHRHLPEAASLTVGEILRWPGVVREAELDPEETQRRLLELLEAALAELLAHRAREGEALAAAIRERAAAIAELVERARALAPEAVEAQRRKLLEALEALGQTPDPQRVEQEVALVAQRLDVAEELDRLSSHLQELERTLTRGGPVGKRLDFLLQEFNREANTLASKAGSLALSRLALEMKVLIEQIREQVQNLE